LNAKDTMTVQTPQLLDATGEFVDSTDLLGDPASLRDRAGRDGYLFFRGLLPASDLAELRSDMLAIVEQNGWLETGSGVDDRIDAQALDRVPDEEMRLDVGVTHAAYDQVQKLESFHRLPHHPRLLSVFEALFGEPVMVHPRHIARMITPHRAMVPTPPHQDFPLIQGTTNTWTCWIPLADCPRERGGLAVLRGSQRDGVLPVSASRGAGGIAVQLCPNEKDWVSTNYRAGDVLTFMSHTVHRALSCRNKQTIRLSLDVRYQPLSEPIEANSLLPHCALTWDQIYAGWKSDELKYYWNRESLQLLPWDDGLPKYQRRIC
jgi:ectoine hydroxylase-related dioxygenase (phytanoyl-CoA dioxygenase family)